MTMPKISLYVSQKIILFSLLLVHICYLVAFCLIGQEVLATANILSVCIYLFSLKLLYDSEENNKITMLILQIEILLHAMLCIFILGLGYGFEILFLTSTISLFFLSISFKILNRIISALQIAAFLLCYLVFELPGTNDETMAYKDAFFIFNLVVSCLFAVITSFLLESSNLFIFLGILEEKESAKAVFNHDPLTGLLNRASMQQIFKQKNLFEGNNFAIVMCDIDNFKKINDTYGHGAGDEVLKNLSAIFKNAFRNEDRVARFGGEEFLAVIFDVRKEKAVSILERIKETLNKNIVEYENHRIKATMTFGVVAHSGNTEVNIERMIKQADELLYIGKRSGKNIVISADYDPKG